MADLALVHAFLNTTLKTALEAGHAAYFDGAVPDGIEVPIFPNGDARPHACLWLGDDEVYPGALSIDEDAVANALGILPFSVVCVASNNLVLTQVRDIVRRALTGKWVPDGGQIINTGGTAEQPQRGVLKPQRLFRTVDFVTTVGASGLVPA